MVMTSTLHTSVCLHIRDGLEKNTLMSLHVSQCILFGKKVTENMKGYQLPITIITNHLRKHPVLQTNKSVYCFKHAFCLGMAQNGMLLRVTCVKGDHVGDQLVEGDVPIELASCSAATHLQFNTQLLGFGNISLLHLHLVI